MLCPFNPIFLLRSKWDYKSERGRERRNNIEWEQPGKKKIKTAKTQQKQQWVCWQASRGLEAECVTALWQLFVSGRFRANWCKRHSQGLLHESTCSWGVGSTPHSLLGLHSNLFYVGMQTSSTISKASGVFVCVWLSILPSLKNSVAYWCKKFFNTCCWLHKNSSFNMLFSLYLVPNSWCVFAVEGYFNPCYYWNEYMTTTGYSLITFPSLHNYQLSV